MALVRIWFLAILAACILRDKPLVETEPDDYDYAPTIISQESEPMELPEYEFRSFLDQETGIWIK